MAPARFAFLQDYTPLGEFEVMEYVNLSEPLSRVLAATETAGDAGLLTPEVLARLVARLPKSGDDSLGEMLRFFSFSVWGKSKERVVEGDGSQATWRWSKPASAYRKAGRWDADLGRVLEEGEWSAGKGFVLLV